MNSKPSKQTPLVDTNTLLAIESLFRKKGADPWAVRLACTLADLYVYSDYFRFTLGSPIGVPADPDLANTSLVAQTLRRLEPSVAVPLIVPITEPVKLHDDYVTEAFRKFAIWTRTNRRALRTWLNSHDTPSIRAMQQAQVGREYYFDLERLAGNRALQELGSFLPAQQSEVLYAFDNVLRAPLYGRLTGEDQHYLNHPLRNASLLPTFEAEVGPAPRITVSFAESMSKIVQQLSLEEYCIILHELRGAVRSQGIHELPRGNIDKEVLRSLAASVSFPPSLRNVGRFAALAGGIIGGLAVFPELATPVTAAGAVVSVCSSLWSGGLPRSASRIKWLRWAMEWDLERQADL